jgi:uncharacterized protein YodC (DUF2158 family)
VLADLRGARLGMMRGLSMLGGGGLRLADQPPMLGADLLGSQTREEILSESSDDSDVIPPLSPWAYLANERPDVRIDEVLATDLAGAAGTSIGFWLNLQAQYDARMARADQAEVVPEPQVITEEKALQVGDCVQLNSGGPPMTIAGLFDRDGVPFAHVWFYDGKLIEARFVAATLKRVVV